MRIKAEDHICHSVFPGERAWQRMHGQCGWRSGPSALAQVARIAILTVHAQGSSFHITEDAVSA